MWRATVAGHICADLRPKLGGDERIVPGAIVEVGPLDIRPGGSVANTGGDLAALGAHVLLVADLGHDELGSTVARALLTVGADCRGIRQVAGLTTSYSWVPMPPSTGPECSRTRSIWCILATRRCYRSCTLTVAVAFTTSWPGCVRRVPRRRSTSPL
jgi:hypothetical protein